MATKLNKGLVGGLTIGAMVVMGAVGILLIRNLPGTDPSRFEAEAAAAEERGDWSVAMQNYYRAFQFDRRATAQAKAARLAKAARCAFELGEFNSVKGLLTQARVNDPQNREAQELAVRAEYELAKFYPTSPQWKALLDEAERLVKIDPTHALGQEALGTSYLALSGEDSAYKDKGEAALREAVKLNPSNTDAVTTLAEFLFRENRTADSDEVIKSAMQLAVSGGNKEAQASLHVYRGRRLLSEGKFDEAQTEFAEAGRLMPTLSDSHVALATYWLFKGREHISKAAEELSKAIEIDPKQPETYFSLARLYAQDGKQDAQLATLEQGLKNIERGKGFRSIRGNIYRITFMKEAMLVALARAEATTQPAAALATAEEWLKRATNEVGPDDNQVRLMRARMLRAQNKIIEATREAEQLDKLLGRRRDIEVKTLLADLYAAQGAYGAAVTALRDAQAVAPNSVTLYLALAKLYLRQNMAEDALRALQAEGSPALMQELAANREAALLRSECYRRLNRTQEIERERRIIEQTAGGTPLDQLRNAQLLAVQERFDEAEAAARAIIKDSPGTTGAYALLAQILNSRKPPDVDGARAALAEGLRRNPDDRNLKLLMIGLDPSQDPKVQEAKMLEFINEEQNPFLRAIQKYFFYTQRENVDEAGLKAAEQALAEAERADPSSPAVIEFQFKLAVRRKDWAAADKCCERDAALNADGTKGRILRGRLAAAQGNLPRAIQFYREGLAEYPSNGPAWIMLAAAYLQNNQTLEARNCLEQHALKLDPSNGDANRMMAAILISGGEKAAARPYLEAAARAIPNDPYVREQRQLLADEDDPAAGIPEREKLRRAEPQNARNLLALGRLYAKTRKPEQAGEALQAAVEAIMPRINEGDRNNYLLLSDAAEVYGKLLDRPADGERILSEALKKVDAKENKSIIAALMGNFYEELESFENAERYYLLSANLLPSVTSTAAAGEFYARVNRAADALDWFQKARDLCKDDVSLLPAIRQRIIQAAILLRDRKKAESEIDRYIADYPSDEQGLLFRGLYYLQLGDVANAEKAFQQQLERKADSAIALWQLGQIHMMRERWSRAIEFLNKAKAVRPDGFNYEHRISLARAMIGAGEFDNGVAELRSVLSAAPNTTSAATTLIEQYIQANRLQEAEAVAVEYMRRLPDDHRWPLYVGQIGLKLRDNRKAVDGFLQAAHASRFATSPTLQLLAALEQGKRYDDVIEFVTKRLPAVRRRRMPMAEAALAKAYAAKGLTEDAAKSFDLALTMARDDFEAYRYIAVTMADALGQEKAIEQTSARLAADEQAGRSTIEALKLLMQLHFKAKNYDQAVETGERIINAADRDDDLLFGLLAQGIVLTEMKRFEDARQKYEKALLLDPSNPVALNNIAFILSDNLKRPQDALPYAEKAESIAPRDPNTLDTVGWVLAEAGRLNDAEGTLLKALDIDPKNLPAIYHLGIVYKRLGNKDDARSRLEAAVKLSEQLKDMEYGALAAKALEEL